ncbi:hypothetical protein [Palleronia sp. LCG004]|uniref:hypothetical protein n=1 Tax=Palleronia sp. LCG004 TaxID=3079304 RepID=UPI002941C757|nr:hypothetical protein [Palleronia sp. LCG004]WOI55481.1 hypothetical protein RVY76_10545 [Palleronia sp. LCG004]
MNDIIRVFSIDLPPEEAARFARDAKALESALGVAVPPDRVQVVEPAALADIGLANYLVEGEGAKADAVAIDRSRLEKIRMPILLILPDAIKGPVTLRPAPPLELLGEYPLEEARGSDGAIRARSAEGPVAGPPPRTDDATTDRRASGYVAVAALVVALLIAAIVWLVAI